MAKQPTEKQLAARAAAAERLRKMHAEKKGYSFSIEEKINEGSVNKIPIDSLYSPDGNGTLIMDKVTPGTIIHGSKLDFSSKRIEQFQEHSKNLGVELEMVQVENGLVYLIYAKKEA